MLDKWFGAAAAKQFGTQMAMLLVQRATSEAEKSARAKSAKKGEKRFDAALLSIERKLAEFKTSNRLNIYSKAQLGSAFKFALLDNGFEQGDAEKLTTWLMLKCK
jgi:hypothetical protein